VELLAHDAELERDRGLGGETLQLGERVAASERRVGPSRPRSSACAGISARGPRSSDPPSRSVKKIEGRSSGTRIEASRSASKP
jgi:hypothetical protein